MRVEDARDAGNSLYEEALGWQHSPPESLDLVKGNIERFLLTCSRDCVGMINSDTTNRYRRDIIVYTSMLNLCIPNRFYDDEEHDFKYALVYPVQQDGTVNSTAQLSRVGTDLEYDPVTLNTLYIVNPIRRNF